MVSSTFYDLREVRQQLGLMIEVDLGYQALISEAVTFPIDPDATTIENCRRRVEEQADILVLVIGQRYGSVDHQSGRSVTNLEYSAARAKGIPIYAFIDRDALTLFDAWQRAAPENRPAVGATVEDARLFEFIERVRNIDRIWTTSFSYASDITASLRVQFAHLMSRGLMLQKSLTAHPDRDALDLLSPQAYRIALDRARFWEYFLFAQVLDDAIATVRSLRREYDLRIVYGSTVTLTDEELFQWMQDRITEISELGHNVGAALNIVDSAFGPPGEPGNIREILFIALQLAKAYRAAIEWSQLVRRARTTATDLQKAIDELSTVGSDMIQKIGDFAPLVREQLNAAIEDLDTNPVPPGAAPRSLDVTLHLKVVNLDRFIESMERAMKSRGIGS
jgi:hypothetical protein